MNILKNRVASVLCSDVVGAFLAKVFNNKIPSYRYGKFTYDCSSEHILNSVKASIFWGIYESAEVRFIRKYLRSDLDVVELGASIGIVTTQILDRIDENQKLIAVEANPYLVNTLRNNLLLNSRFNNFSIINKAINYDDKNEVRFYIEKENVNSSTKKNDGSFIKAVSTKLSEILTINGLSSYILVCDIEGTEIDILLNEPEHLINCEQLFIELHNTELDGVKYDVNDMVRLLTEKIGFNFINNYGTVYYFNR